LQRYAVNLYNSITGQQCVIYRDQSRQIIDSSATAIDARIHYRDQSRQIIDSSATAIDAQIDYKTALLTYKTITTSSKHSTSQNFNATTVTAIILQAATPRSFSTAVVWNSLPVDRQYQGSLKYTQAGKRTIGDPSGLIPNCIFVLLMSVRTR